MGSLQALIHPENLQLLQANGLLRDAHQACTAGGYPAVSAPGLGSQGQLAGQAGEVSGSIGAGEQCFGGPGVSGAAAAVSDPVAMTSSGTASG